MPNREAIIAIHDGPKTPRKVVRLVATGDESSSVSAPYHPATNGPLLKTAALLEHEQRPGGYVPRAF